MLLRGGRNVIVNATFARLIGKDPIGARISHPDHSNPEIKDYTVVGVVNDFHFKPVYEPIGPLLLEYNLDQFRWFVFARFSGDARETAEFIQQKFKQFSGGRNAHLTFVSDEFDSMYGYVRFRGDILGYFTLLACGLSCLGLCGLASFVTATRTKEIGIRKVVGASVIEISTRLTVGFVKWVLLANLIGWPIAWLLLFPWTEDFPYHAQIGFDLFLLAAGLSLLVAIATVSVRAVRAATANPIDSIRFH